MGHLVVKDFQPVTSQARMAWPSLFHSFPSLSNRATSSLTMTNAPRWYVTLQESRDQRILLSPRSTGEPTTCSSIHELLHHGTSLPLLKLPYTYGTAPGSVLFYSTRTMPLSSSSWAPLMPLAPTAVFGLEIHIVAEKSIGSELLKLN